MKRILAFILLMAALATARAQYINRDGYTIWTGRMGVGKNPANVPHPGAWLELGDSGTVRSFILPRVAGNNVVAYPKAGMFHYDVLTNRLYYRKPEGWYPLLDSTFYRPYVDSLYKDGDNLVWTKDGRATSLLVGKTYLPGSGIAIAPDNTISVVGYNPANWDAAYSWGPHAGLYRPAAWLPDWSEVLNKPAEFTPAANSGYYIQNQTATTQTAGFNISGNGRAATFELSGQTVDPAGSNGMLAYNATAHQFRGYRNGVWVDFGMKGDYIENQSTAAQANSSFWVSGNSRIEGSLTLSTNSGHNASATDKLYVNGTSNFLGNMSVTGNITSNSQVSAGVLVITPVYRAHQTSGTVFQSLNNKFFRFDDNGTLIANTADYTLLPVYSSTAQQFNTRTIKVLSVTPNITVLSTATSAGAYYGYYFNPSVTVEAGGEAGDNIYSFWAGQGRMYSAGTFARSSGSSSYAQLELKPTINQTGTASGAIYGVYYNPTLTSVLGTHWGVYINAGNNYFAGKMIVGKPTTTFGSDEVLNVYGGAYFGGPSGAGQRNIRIYTDNTISDNTIEVKTNGTVNPSVAYRGYYFESTAAAANSGSIVGFYATNGGFTRSSGVWRGLFIEGTASATTTYKGFEVNSTLTHTTNGGAYGGQITLVESATYTSSSTVGVLGLDISTSITDAASTGITTGLRIQNSNAGSGATTGILVKPANTNNASLTTGSWTGIDAHANFDGSVGTHYIARFRNTATGGGTPNRNAYTLHVTQGYGSISQYLTANAGGGVAIGGLQSAAEQWSGSQYAGLQTNLFVSSPILESSLGASFQTSTAAGGMWGMYVQNLNAGKKTTAISIAKGGIKVVSTGDGFVNSSTTPQSLNYGIYVDASGAITNYGLYVNSGLVHLPVMTTDPTGAANGDIAYNSTSHQFRGYRNGAWSSFVMDGDVILNQTATTQTGGFNISGTGTVGILWANGVMRQTIGSSNNIAIVGGSNNYGGGGSYNHIFGIYAGRWLTSGTSNVAIGYAALQQNVSSSIAIGYAALQLATSSNNIAIGHQAATELTSGSGIYIGYRAGTDNATGAYNLIIGNSSATTNQNSPSWGKASHSNLIIVGHNVINNTNGYGNDNTAITNSTYIGNGINVVRNNAVFLGTATQDLVLLKYATGTGGGKKALMVGEDGTVTAETAATGTADGNTYVTSGSFASNTLTLTRNDGQSVNIPFNLPAVALSGSYNDLADKPAPYTLPTASSGTLGGIKVGSRLEISVDGALSVVFPQATYSAVAGVNRTLSTSGDYYVGVDASGGESNVYLPPISSATNGQTYVVYKSDNTANPVNIFPAAGDTIEGATSRTLSSQYKKVLLFADRTAGDVWIVGYAN